MKKLRLAIPSTSGCSEKMEEKVIDVGGILLQCYFRAGAIIMDIEVPDEEATSLMDLQDRLWGIPSLKK